MQVIDFASAQAYNSAEVVPPLSVGIDMICIATTCTNRASKPGLLAQVLSKSSDFLICASGKS
jgi:hypothetical protein